MNSYQTPSSARFLPRQERRTQGADFTLIHPEDAPSSALEVYLNDQGERYQIKVVTANPPLIALIHKPSKHVQMAAVKADPKAFFEIKGERDEDVVCAYLETDPRYIFNLKKATEGMLITALRADPSIFAFIEQPWSETVEDLYTALIGKY